MEPFDALDEDLDEAQPHAPAGLHAVGERLLARAAELELDDRAGPTVEQRLLRVLRAVGRVEHGRGEQTSVVDGDLLQSAGEWDSEARENRTR